MEILIIIYLLGVVHLIITLSNAFKMDETKKLIKDARASKYKFRKLHDRLGDDGFIILASFSWPIVLSDLLFKSLFSRGSK